MSAPPPLNALRAFETAVRTGSFRAAGEELAVTQSAVSHQIRALEDWFGAPLFARSGNRARPLPHAEELARALSRSLAAINAACERAQVARTPRPLVIGAIPSVAVCWLIPRLPRFRAAHPGIDVQIVYAIHGQDIDFREIHIAFVFSRSVPDLPDATTEAFLPGDSVPVCSPQLAARLGDGDLARTIAALGLLHDTNLSGWQNWLERVGCVDPPPAGPVFEDFSLLRAAALLGQGVALCPESMIRPDLAAGRLVSLSSVRVLEEVGYYLLRKTGSSCQMQRKIDAFHRWVIAERDRDRAD